MASAISLEVLLPKGREYGLEYALEYYFNDCLEHGFHVVRE